MSGSMVAAGGERPRRLVVIPSDPLAAYEPKGMGPLIEAYYNPQGFFSEVLALSPLEHGERIEYGMRIIGIPEKHFRTALTEYRPDVVRAYGGHWPTALACRQRVPGIPVVVSIHDSRLGMVSAWVRDADLVMCVSKTAETAALRRGADPHRIRILGDRVDTKTFSRMSDAGVLARLRAQWPQGKFILHVGRKAPQKNLDNVIRALGLLPASYFCVFVGPGDTAPYRAQAQALGVAGRCFWVESVLNTQLPAWYSACDVFCVPSRFEGFGIVFLEAAACGAPIVTTKIAPMTDYLCDGADALLVENCEDARSIADAIRRLGDDTEYGRRLGASARRVAERFSREVVDEREVGLYREALALPPRPRRMWTGAQVRWADATFHVPRRCRMWARGLRDAVFRRQPR